MSDAIEAACRAHAPQWDGIDPEIQRYAREQMIAALTAYEAAKGGGDLPRVDGLIAPPLEIGYTNYRGEFAVRCIVPISFWYGSTDWHPDPQWLVKAYDADKGAERDFAFKDFSALTSPASGEREAATASDESGE